MDNFTTYAYQWVNERAPLVNSPEIVQHISRLLAQGEIVVLRVDGPDRAHVGIVVPRDKPE